MCSIIISGRILFKRGLLFWELVHVSYLPFLDAYVVEILFQCVLKNEELQDGWTVFSLFRIISRSVKYYFCTRNVFSICLEITIFKWFQHEIAERWFLTFRALTFRDSNGLTGTHHIETFEGSKKSDQFDVLEADIRQECEQWTPDASFQRSVQTRIFGLIDSICGTGRERRGEAE